MAITEHLIRYSATDRQSLAAAAQQTQYALQSAGIRTIYTCTAQTLETADIAYRMSYSRHGSCGSVSEVDLTSSECESMQAKAGDYMRIYATSGTSSILLWHALRKVPQVTCISRVRFRQRSRQGSTNVFSLPAELRNRVYSLVLTQDGALRVYAQKEKSASVSEEHRRIRTCALTQTCRQFRRESLPVYYGSNTFIVDLGIDVALQNGTPWYKTPACQWLRSIPEGMAKHIPSLTVRVSLQATLKHARLPLVWSKPCGVYCHMDFETGRISIRSTNDATFDQFVQALPLQGMLYETMQAVTRLDMKTCLDVDALVALGLALYEAATSSCKSAYGSDCAPLTLGLPLTLTTSTTMPTVLTAGPWSTVVPPSAPIVQHMQSTHSSRATQQKGDRNSYEDNRNGLLILLAFFWFGFVLWFGPEMRDPGGSALRFLERRDCALRGECPRCETRYRDMFCYYELDQFDRGMPLPGGRPEGDDLRGLSIKWIAGYRYQSMKDR